MNIEKMLEKKEFSLLSRKQKETLIKAAKEIKDKSPAECALLFTSYINDIEAERKLSADEKIALIGLIFENMDNNEKKRAKDMFDTVERFGFRL